MDSYLQQLEKDFGKWGNIFTPETLLSKDPSPFKRLINKGYSKENSRLVFSVCPDDINRLPERKGVELTLKKHFGGEFHLGNLAAYPIGGITGITAVSHHVPHITERGESKPGNLIFLISPHVGLVITADEVIYGHTFRPGQKKSTNSCGAMMGFLHYLRHAEKFEDIQKISEDVNDPTRVILFRELLEEYQKDIEDLLKIIEMNKLVIEASKLNYKVVITKFNAMLKQFLEKESFKGNYAIIGGITVNTKDTDYFIFRDYFLNSTPI